MPTAMTGSELEIEYSVEIRDKDGNLIYREASVKAPEYPPQPKLGCPNNNAQVKEYRKAFKEWLQKCDSISNLFEAIRDYHTARCAYCQRHRHDMVELRYRMGEPSPQTIEEARKELRILLGR